MCCAFAGVPFLDDSGERLMDQGMEGGRMMMSWPGLRGSFVQRGWLSETVLVSELGAWVGRSWAVSKGEHRTDRSFLSFSMQVSHFVDFPSL